jgi:hypothetical protein
VPVQSAWRVQSNLTHLRERRWRGPGSHERVTACRRFGGCEDAKKIPSGSLKQTAAKWQLVAPSTGRRVGAPAPRESLCSAPNSAQSSSWALSLDGDRADRRDRKAPRPTTRPDRLHRIRRLLAPGYSKGASRRRHREGARPRETLGRKPLGELASLATPETILRWYRETIAAKYDGSRTRGAPSRPPTRSDKVQLLTTSRRAAFTWLASPARRTALGWRSSPAT